MEEEVQREKDKCDSSVKYLKSIIDQLNDKNQRLELENKELQEKPIAKQENFQERRKRSAPPDNDNDNCKNEKRLKGERLSKVATGDTFNQ